LSELSDGIRFILRLIALGCVAAVGFYALTRWAAPGHDQAAVFVGLLLTSFGAALAKFAMELVVMPLAFLQTLQRVLRGKKPLVVNQPGPDPLDVFGRVLFVVGFATLAGLVGAVAGFAEGGAGLIASAAAFAVFGAVLAMLLPNDVLWGAEDNYEASVTQAYRDDMAQARREGEPTVLFADRVARGVRDKLFEDQGKP
jgi:hypothetical protein